MDNFDKAREAIWGQPGFDVKRSTIIAPGLQWLKGATWIVETVRTDDTAAIFLQWIGEDGGQRMVIPNKVALAIYNHQHAIMKNRRKTRSKRGAETRRLKTATPQQDYRQCDTEHLRPYPDCLEECDHDECVVPPAAPPRHIDPLL